MTRDPPERVKNKKIRRNLFLRIKGILEVPVVGFLKLLRRRLRNRRCCDVTHERRSDRRSGGRIKIVELIETTGE